MTFFYLEQFLSALVILVYVQIFRSINFFTGNPLVSLLALYPIFIIVYLAGYQRSLIRAFVWKISSKEKQLNYFYQLASFYISGDKPHIVLDTMRKHNFTAMDIGNILYKKRERIDLKNWDSISEYAYIYYGNVHNVELWKMEKQFPQMQEIFIRMHENLPYIIEDHLFDEFIQK